MAELTLDGYHEHQERALLSTKPYIFLGCGVGAGKTHVGSGWVMPRLVQQHSKAIGLIGANSYAQLIDSTLRNVFKLWDSWKIKYYPTELPRSHKPFSVFVRISGTWKEILCRSLDSYLMLSGIELSWAWLDEVFQTKKDAIDVVDARLRDSREADLPPDALADVPRTKNQLLLTTTLDDPSTWMYEMFVDKYNPDLMDVVYATSYANEKNLPPGYVERLRASYTTEMFKRMVLAEWVFLGGLQVYYAFNRERNINDEIAEFDPNLPIRWTHDFNIGQGKPMSSALCQIKKHNGKPVLTVFDEIILESSDTHDAADEFKNRGWFQRQQNVIIYGDASGKHNDSRSKTTDYGILSNAGFHNHVVPAANPPIRERHNAVNALFCNANDEVRCFFHSRCKTAAKGFETVKLKKGAQYLEEETYWQHVTTAIGYLINVEFPLIHGGVTTSQIIGM